MGNLLVFKLSGKRMRSPLPEDEYCQSIDFVAGIRLCDPITSITRGSIVKDVVGEDCVKILNSFVFGTCKGQIGVIFQLDPQSFALLAHIEQKLLDRPERRCVGGLDQADSMQFCNRLMESEHFSFVSGDLVETFSDLDNKDVTKILKAYKAPQREGKEPKLSSADVMKLLDELSQLH